MNAPKRSKAISENFPLFLREDFDLTFPNAHWPVGLHSTFPNELKRRIAAAIISYQMQNKGIDYTYKRYLSDHEYPRSSYKRLDLSITRLIKIQCDRFSELIYQVTSIGPKSHGEVISEWTYLRIPESIKFLASCANKGALFESAAVARTMLEQIAWACKISTLNDLYAIKGESATKSVSDLKRSCPSAGKAYGWLSKYSHWAYDAHIKAWSYENDKLRALSASPEFKAISLSLTLLILIIAISSFSSLKSETIEYLMNLNDDELTDRPDQEDSTTWSLIFPTKPTVSDIQQALNLTPLLEGIDSIRTVCPDEQDIGAFLQFAREIALD